MLNNQVIAKYFFNTSWLGLEKLVRIGLSIIIGALVARYLGPEQFGMLNFAIAMVLLFSTLSTLGLEGIIVRELVQFPSQTERILGTGLVLRLIGFLLAATGVLWVTRVLGLNSLLTSLILVLAAGYFFQSFQVFDYYFQAHVLARYSSYSQLLSLIFTSAAKIGLILLNAPLIWFGVVTLSESILIASFFFLFFWFMEKRVCLRFDSSLAKKFLKNSWPLIFSGAFVSIYIRIDQIMINEMVSSSAVGYYSAAVSICEILYFFPMIINTSLFPAIIQSQQSDKNHYRNRQQSLYYLLILFSLGTILFFLFFSKPVVYLLFGHNYHSAADVLRIYIWTSLFVGFGVTSERTLLVENLQHISLLRTLLGGATNVILNLLFIPRWGIVGAAWATVIAQAVACYLSLALFKETRETFILMSESLNPFHFVKKFRNLPKLIA